MRIRERALRAQLALRTMRGRTPARTARHSRRLLQPLRTRWKALSKGSLTLSKTCSSSCCCLCSIVTRGSRAILLPHSRCKQHWQPEWTAAKRCSSSVGRDEIRREAAAGIQQQQPASSDHPLALRASRALAGCGHRVLVAAFSIVATPSPRSVPSIGGVSWWPPATGLPRRPRAHARKLSSRTRQRCS